VINHDGCTGDNTTVIHHAVAENGQISSFVS